MSEDLELLPVAEVARLWRCSREHVYGLIAAGDLPAVQIATGRAKTRVPASAAHEYIRRNTRTVTRSRS